MMWFVIGVATGILNGLMLRWTVGRLRPKTSLVGVPLVAFGFLLRMGLATALLVLASQRGMTTCLLSFAGLWLARWTTILVTAFPHLFVQLQRS